MEPKNTISKVKAIYLMEGAPHEADVAYGFSGLILEMEDGRIIPHSTTDVMQQFTEMKPDHKNYEQLKLLMK